MDKCLEDIITSGFGDVWVCGLGWVDDSMDFWMEFELPNHSLMKLLFVWTTNVLIDLDFGDMAGRALTWEGKLERINEKRWRVHLDFAGAPPGEIRFECDDIRLYSEPG